MLPVLLGLLSDLSYKSDLELEQVFISSDKQYIDEQIGRAVAAGASENSTAMYQLNSISKKLDTRMSLIESLLKQLNARIESEQKLAQKEAEAAGKLNIG